MSGQITSNQIACQEHRNHLGQFVAGVLSSPNPIRPGQRISPATEFKPGVPARNKLPVGSIRLRKRKRKGDQPRSWIKIAEPNKWILLAHWVWMQANGPIPHGYEIHHRNRNANDDRLENLQLVTPQEHSRIHLQDRIAAKVGMTFPLKTVSCIKCGESYQAKKRGGLCGPCGQVSETESKRRYQQRKAGAI